jgi:hypothetical protein
LSERPLGPTEAKEQAILGKGKPYEEGGKRDKAIKSCRHLIHSMCLSIRAQARLFLEGFIGLGSPSVRWNYVYVGSQASDELKTKSSGDMKQPKVREIVEWALYELRLDNKEWKTAIKKETEDKMDIDT